MTTIVTQQQQVLLRMAAKALGRNGLAHAYGHCSLKLNDHEILVCAPRPMGLLRPHDDGTVVLIDGPLPDRVLGEVRLHQRIYRQRPDIKGVCRSMPPALMKLSALGKVPRPRHGMGAYFWPQPAYWPHVDLIRQDEMADLAITTMNNSRALVMRGNGVIVCADDLKKACVLTWFLENAASIELEALRCGLEDQGMLTEDEAQSRAVWTGGIVERMWSWLTDDDEESKS